MMICQIIELIKYISDVPVTPIGILPTDFSENVLYYYIIIYHIKITYTVIENFILITHP